MTSVYTQRDPLSFTFYTHMHKFLAIAMMPSSALKIPVVQFKIVLCSCYKGTFGNKWYEALSSRATLEQMDLTLHTSMSV